MPATIELFRKYMNPVFIETGSHYGNGIQVALDAGFKTIYSIELGEHLYDACKRRFAGLNINLILGDSHLVLGEILNKINKPITFWLDAHWSKQDTVHGKYISPLIQELEIISKHYIKKHIIIIDDLRDWKVEYCGFDCDMVRAKLLEINKNYKFIYEDGHIKKDILVAKL
jgi:hypothetical protein